MLSKRWYSDALIASSGNGIGKVLSFREAHKINDVGGRKRTRTAE
jgi:hypothetical protein